MQTALTPEESEMFKTLVVDYHAAWSPGHEPFNISNAERYYGKDDELTAYDVMHTDGVIKGWEKYKIELIKIMQGFADFNISLNKNDVEVFRHGEIVWTASYFRIQGMFKNGQPLESMGRTTLIWKHQEDGNWLIAHEHSSLPITS